MGSSVPRECIHTQGPWGAEMERWGPWRPRFSTVFFFFFFKFSVESATATAKSLQSCPTLCDPVDGSPPGSPVPGILQAKTLEWAAISFSNAWKWNVKMKSLNRVWLLATPWTAAYQAPPSMGFSRQECWNGVPLSSPSVEYSWFKMLCKFQEYGKVNQLYIYIYSLFFSLLEL